MPSAYSVPMASDVLPDPDTPTTATVRHSGTSTSISRRLLCRAPRTSMTVGRVPGTEMSPAAIPVNLRPSVQGCSVRTAPGRRSPGPGAVHLCAHRTGAADAEPVVEAQRLHDLERGGPGEHLD